jgi:hypothetical protein
MIEWKAIKVLIGCGDVIGAEKVWPLVIGIVNILDEPVEFLYLWAKWMTIDKHRSQPSPEQNPFFLLHPSKFN